MLCIQLIMLLRKKCNLRFGKFRDFGVLCWVVCVAVAALHRVDEFPRHDTTHPGTNLPLIWAQPLSHLPITVHHTVLQFKFTVFFICALERVKKSQVFVGIYVRCKLSHTQLCNFTYFKFSR